MGIRPARKLSVHSNALPISAAVRDLSDRVIEHDSGASVFNPSFHPSLKVASSKSKELLRQVIDADPNLIFVKDRNGRFALINQAMANVYGVPVDQIEGRNQTQFSHSIEEVRNYSRDDLRVIDGGKELIIPEEPVTDVSGATRWFHTVKRPFVFGNSAEVHVLGVATDITEQRRLRDQLSQTQKMEALGQLAGGIAHDFNNLLTGIIGYATLLKLERPKDPEVQKIAQMIENTGNAATSLTHKLLEFARSDKPLVGDVELGQLARETLGFVERTIVPKIAIETSPASSSESLNVHGDAVRLRQLVLNLVVNARDAIQERFGSTIGGRLELYANVRKVERTLTGVGGSIKPGSYVELIVRDNGCGIPSDILEKIFEPFFSTKSNSELGANIPKKSSGSGMGLALVYSIVTEHNGIVRISTQVGVGTEFQVLLPSAKL